MDSHEWNKIAGGVLGTVLFVLVIRLVSGAIFDQEAPVKPGYIVPGVVEDTSSASAVPVAEVMPDWGTVLPAADVAKGHDISHKCEQCHDLTKGGPNKIGPNLWGVIARPRASHPGFDYSSAMKAKGGNWTFDEVFKFVKSPQAYIEGTKMSFAGLASAQDRINLIAYLRQDFGFTGSDSGARSEGGRSFSGRSARWYSCCAYGSGGKFDDACEDRPGGDACWWTGGDSGACHSAEEVLTRA